jgi:thiosulfate reductase cytochrome b subunit
MSKTVTREKRQDRRRSVYRHTLPIRATHWINVLCLTLLLMSGLQIFNAHPALYWGERSDFAHPLLAMGAMEAEDGMPVGVTTVLGHPLGTTGVLGLSAGPGGRLEARGFPDWATVPSYQDLAAGRHWHFFFAWIFVVNGLAYLAYSFLSRHVGRDLVPSSEQMKHIGRSVRDHLRFRFPRGEEAKHYNVLQKLSYLVVIFGLLPLVVLAGLTMSPQLDTGFPLLVTLFDGRQSARTVHFIAAAALVAFTVVHVLMVLVSGVWNNLRSMVTGRYVIEPGSDHARCPPD